MKLAKIDRKMFYVLDNFNKQFLEFVNPSKILEILVSYNNTTLKNYNTKHL